jgi:hypothetical protein
MALITHAYFEEGDFSKVSLLEETYSNLNSCLSADLLDSIQAFEGIEYKIFHRGMKNNFFLSFVRSVTARVHSAIQAQSCSAVQIAVT